MNGQLHRGCSAAHAGTSKQIHSLQPFRSSLCGRRCCGPSATPGRQGNKAQLQVMAVKGQGKKRAQQMQQMGGPPPTPPVDPDNVEFVIFIRARKFPQWYPLSIVKAGSAANALVRSLDTDWGKKLYGKTLIRNIAKSIYADKRNIERSFRQQAPMMQKFTDFEYAFKIRDKSTPNDWYQAEHLTILPAEKDLGGTVVDKLRENLQKRFGIGQ